MKYHCVGIPTTGRFDGGQDLTSRRMSVSVHGNTPFGIQWQCCREDALYPERVKTAPRGAFGADDLDRALQGRTVIIRPTRPRPGVRVAFIGVNGAPVELLPSGTPRRWRAARARGARP